MYHGVNKKERKDIILPAAKRLPTITTGERFLLCVVADGAGNVLVA
jgi:hypothetical protein